MYFSDRPYSNEELPKDFKVNVSGENQPAPSTNTVETAEKSSAAAAVSKHRGHGKAPSKPTTETGGPTPAQISGPESAHGFHTILDSVEKEPLKLWQKAVSV